jgi:hypothetical protein
MAVKQNLDPRWRQRPACIARLQKYCLLRWTCAQTGEMSARWFAAADRCARLHRMAGR